MNSGKVPKSLRHSFELVRTCNQDLQYLITLRNESTEQLEARLGALKRVDTVIVSANRGLEQAFRIVEKFRLDADRGKITLQNRMEWMLSDSREFQSQEPVISRHHAEVLAEINYVRSLLHLASSQESERQQACQDGSVTVNDSGLLGNRNVLLERVSSDSAARRPITPMSQKTQVSNSFQWKLDSYDPLLVHLDLPEPVYPDAMPLQQPRSHQHVASTLTPPSKSTRYSSDWGQDNSGTLSNKERPVSLDRDASQSSGHSHVLSITSSSEGRPSTSLLSMPSVSSLHDSRSTSMVDLGHYHSLHRSEHDKASSSIEITRPISSFPSPPLYPSINTRVASQSQLRGHFLQPRIPLEHATNDNGTNAWPSSLHQSDAQGANTKIPMCLCHKQYPSQDSAFLPHPAVQANADAKHLEPEVYELDGSTPSQGP